MGDQHMLARLNEAPAEALRAELLQCNGSTAWVDGVLSKRPFASKDDLLAAADAVWATATRDARLEAFRAHPRIGGTKAQTAQSSTAQAWSNSEQSGTAGAASDVMTRLAAGNDAYFTKFGFIFIVFASGKSADQMLALLEARLGNTEAQELDNAAEEQRKITRLRLERWLAS